MKRTDYKAIAIAFATRHHAKIIYTSPDACGVRYPDGQCRKVTVEAMLDDITEARR